MASKESRLPSTSISSDRHNWDVFLSFRGPDTRRTFTSHLYSSLHKAGIKTYMDDAELSRGGEIPQQLLAAIQDSEISLVVFSETYASSPWCLNELVEILRCKRSMGHSVYPIFYNISPSVVRRRTRSFSAAFEIHEKRHAYNRNIVDKWKAVLTAAADLSGFDLQNHAHGNEAKLVEMILKEVERKVKGVGLAASEEHEGKLQFQEEILHCTCKRSL